MQEKKRGLSSNYKQDYGLSKLLKLWGLLSWAHLLK